MKLWVLLLFIHVSYINSKTINNSGYCAQQAKDTRGRKTEFDQYKIDNTNVDDKDVISISNPYTVNKEAENKNGRRNEQDYDIIERRNDNTQTDIIKITQNGKLTTTNKLILPLSTPPNEIKKNKAKKPQPIDSEKESVNKTKITKANSNKKTSDNDNFGDITNIRELREQLLDHLLDYFINIIKEEEQYTETRKKNGKDKMKVENKLRNYYNPDHMDDILYTNESDFNDLDMNYPNGRRKGNELPTNKKNATCKNIATAKNTTNPKFKTTGQPKTSKNNNTKNNTILNYLRNKNTTRVAPKTHIEVDPPILAHNESTSPNITEEIKILNINHHSPVPVKDIIVEEHEISRVSENKIGTDQETETIKTLHKNDTDLSRNAIKTTLNKTANNNFNEGDKDNITNHIEASKNSETNDDTVDLTKAIVIKKNCATDTEGKNEVEIIKRELPQQDCKRNIILQFNINM